MRSLVKHFMFLALIVLGATGAWAQTNNTIDLSTVTSNITVTNGQTLTGTLGAKVTIYIASGAVVTLHNVSINADGAWTDGSHAGLTCDGDALIILSGTNIVKGFHEYNYPGIRVPANSTLTIQGTGSLDATGGIYSAGIGSGCQVDCGNIVINGGTITATGGSIQAAGIGGSAYRSCGNININGGTVVATGGSNAPGIGGGYMSSCGTITISNSVDRVTAIKGSNAPRSIGKSSYQSATCGAVTIGGVVYWDGTDYKNGGDNPLTGIVRSPYYFPSSILTDIPTGWSVTADGQEVTPTDGTASIPEGAEVVLTPAPADMPRVKDISLLSPEEIPLTFEAMVAGAQVKFKMDPNVVTYPVEFSIDGSTWKNYKSDSAIVLTNIGDKVSFRGQNAAYRGSSGHGSNFSCIGNCYVYGNVMSLIDSTGFATNETLTAPKALSCLFWNNENIYSHASKELVLPATTLTSSCYRSMFENCLHLTLSPALPATEMAEDCYYAMFAYCAGLLSAPALPATTLASRCYSSMFKGCTNLTAAPDLPATTLATSCYSQMFMNCANITSAPELPAPILTDFCYSNMFNGCSMLNEVTCLATYISVAGCTNSWLAGVASSGTFHKPSSMNGWTIDSPDGIPLGWTEKPSEIFLPLTFEAKQDNVTVTFTKASTLSSLTIEYSLDGTTWATYETPITLEHAGEKVSFRGSNARYADNCINNQYSTFSCSAECYIYGNIMSLITKDNFASTTIFPNNTSFTFCNLFENNNKIYNHGSKPLLLPATTLTSSCYRGMFKGCTQLTTAPVLPAKTLAIFCYCDMFRGCTQLTTTPELSVTTLTNSCYRGMFQGCTQLTTAPVLPATTLANYCYADMFHGCTNLETTPALSVMTLAEGCYSNMFHDCTKLTTAPVLPATNLTLSCYSYMFDGCTNLETAPVLPAPNLAQWCYSYMFENCTKLTTAPALPATTLADYCYQSMFDGCTKLESAPALPATNLANNCYSSMFHGCTNLETAPALPATSLAPWCYSYMFENCTKLTTAPVLPATSLAQGCYSSMFKGCTLLTTAPVLPATTLVYYCYNGMFNNCSHLNNVTCLATDITADYCTDYWLTGVASTGTFNKAASMNTWPTGPYSYNVKGIPVGWTVDDYYDPLATPLTFEAMTAGAVVRFTKGSSVTWTNIVEYSLNGGTWMTYTQGTDITLTNMGDKVSFRGNNAKYATSMSDIGAQYSKFSCTNNCYVYGNIMSLIDADDYPTMTVLTSDNEYAFCNLFTGNTNIYNHPSKTLVLPATTLAYRCYGRMFYGCSSLTSTPELLATTLAEGCCYQMFYGCSSLTSAPALLATTLADQCCYNMFHGCSSLSSAPALPATTLAPNCYALMFEGCSNLTSAPALPATTLASSCYSRMFQNCTSLSSAPALPATTLANYCYSSMFYGCSNLTSAPVLPATTLANHCYESMFQGCTILTSAPALPATTLAQSCYQGMFQSCSNLTSAPALPATTLASSCYRQMFQNCTSLSSAPALPATTLASYCYYDMFRGCSNLNSAPALPATTLANYCYSSMFQGCSNLTSAPVLPATTLANYCYQSMFQGCSNLNSVTCLATDISASNCTSNWLSGVAATGTFNKAASMTGWTTGASGIPSGWTVVDAVIDLSTVTTDTIVPNGWTVTGTLGSNVKISIADGATVTLSNVNINGSGTWTSGNYAGLTCEGDATIILSGENILRGINVDYPGIHIKENKTLTIRGTGSLDASGNPTGDCYSAGIGGVYYNKCGNIVIEGGTITATGGNKGGAAIGGAFCGGYGYITISGGTVTATAVEHGAGIGSGCNSKHTSGNITISGGTVTATSQGNGAGIGCGSSANGSVGDILISGGTITATGGNNAAGIGSSNSSSCGDITIANTVTRVTATKGSGALNSIGAGNGGTCGTVTIGGVEGAVSTSPYTYPLGVLSGKFSVSSTKQVYFSQGNLQAIFTSAGSSCTWQFATNQWDFIGGRTNGGSEAETGNNFINGNGSVSASGTVDLFGWVGASSTWTGAAQYGISNSTAMNSTDTYGNNASEALKSDWGNTIGSGWRTLTSNEWTYMFNTRTVNGGTGDGKSYTLGQSVTGKLGIVIYPDNYTGSVYSGSDWASFEAAGCVFLPAAGSRNGASIVNAGSYGYYWSSSPNASDVNYAYRVNFYSNILSPAENGNRYRGYSVRLVRDAN